MQKTVLEYPFRMLNRCSFVTAAYCLQCTKAEGLCCGFGTDTCTLIVAAWQLPAVFRYMRTLATEGRTGCTIASYEPERLG